MKLRFGRSRETKAVPADDHVVDGDRARDDGNWAAAADAYEAALVQDDSLESIWVQYGHARKETGRLDEAERAYRRALALRPGEADTYLQLGHVLKLTGRLGEAAEAYLTSAEIAPDQAETFREIRALGERGAFLPPARLHALIDRIAIAHGPGGGGALRDLARCGGDALEAFTRTFKGRGFAEISVTDAELETLENAARLIGDIARRRDEPSRLGEGAADQRPVVIEVTDLIDHFAHSRAPTGIQRVQLQVVEGLLPQDPDLLICCVAGDRWVQVPAGLFVLLSWLSREGGPVNAPDWKAATDQLKLLLAAAGPFDFPQGAILVNLGTSWIAGYMLHVRNAQRRFGVKYVPFVHDVIPVLFPELCVGTVTPQYIGWLTAVFSHADFFLANSQNTRGDFVRVAGELGEHVGLDDVAVVPLDGDLRQAESAAAPPAATSETGGRPYVLCVSTVEPRKNHVALLDAWAELIGVLGLENTPHLVCVGGRGWDNAPVFARLQANDALNDRVVFLHDIADARLAQLYRGCLFTVYPSVYEGWGLPVTESLCYGKTPVVATVASLPEAGGDFAEYFEPGSQPSLVAAIGRLLGDEAYRREKEARIAAHFRPRAWWRLGQQILEAVRNRFPPAAGGEPETPVWKSPHARFGRYFALGANQQRRLTPGMGSGEIFRSGGAWRAPEAWGCWTQGDGARLAMTLPPGPVQSYFRLCAAPDRAPRVRIGAGGRSVTVELAPSQTQWVRFAFDAGEDGEVMVEFGGVVGVAGFYLQPGGEPALSPEALDGLAADGLAARDRQPAAV